MRQFIKDSFLALLTLASLWLVYACSGCAPATLAPAGAQSPAVTGASVVTLVRPQARWTWGALSSEAGLTSSGFKLQYEKSCNAFAVADAKLVTAAHCVAGFAIGDELLYLSPDGVGYGLAELERVDAARDLAWAHAPGLTALPVTSPPRDGEPALSVSSYYEAANYGVVVSKLSGGFYETSQTIIKGWSGSPVFDGHGRVWGVVSQCHLQDSGTECAPGYTIVTALEELR